MIKSLAIGAFDGVHVAHQYLISQADGVAIIERGNGVLTRGYLRTLYIDKPCFFYHFETLRLLSPHQFIKKLQNDFPCLERIVVGYDFHFGKDKAGNVEVLQEIFDGRVDVIEEILLEEMPVHSRTIKDALREGKISLANKLLGREYEIRGAVIKGQGLGRKEFVPTLNLKVESFLLPKEGTYVTQTKIDNIWQPSISFLGHRLTIDGSFAIETHILDKQSLPQIDNVTIKFIDFLRDNKKFEDFASLKEQIDQDIQVAKGFLDER
ncbi:MAG TPA: bifunctional riboflavin kinase/FAD synthetase [Epsilonproteobacteria bacterium]|nr:bifunctional riboflavin kinase/FAD synthetase [Campylobacterota bacterium]